MLFRWMIWSLLVALVLGAGAWLRYCGGPGLKPRAVATTPAAMPPPPRAKPNVVLISLDTLRPDHLGCFGYAKPTDALNRERYSHGGVLFKNARTQVPWTLPSHMALFTSMLPSHSGVDNINQVLSEHIPTLPEVLHENGYRTAALVNNGQMRAHWGFNRGFETWREFEVDTPQSNCENITNEALQWLESRPLAESDERPFFLFLHYYDAHDPYAAPEPFRSRMGTALSGDQARAIVEEFRDPSRNIENPRLKENLIAAYDAELAWLDSQIARLLPKIPPDALIVIFSDHGEAFEEHGWTLHGATVYDEETRVLLWMRPPGSTPQRQVDAPVMLLDVAPTILTACGIQPPLSFEGSDLSPLWEGKVMPQRLIPLETKAVLEGRITRGLVLYPWKAIYSLFDGKFEFYKLPDEQTDVGSAEPRAANPLFAHLKQWISEEEYWMLHAHGEGDFEATLTAADGRLALFIPVNFSPERDSLDVSEDGKTLHWVCHPHGAPGSSKAIYFQLSNPNAAVRVDLKVNGQADRSQVFLGAKRGQPAALPVETTLADDWQDPVITEPFRATQDGFYLERHRSDDATSRPSRVENLDERTLQQLRSLGYVR